MDGKHYGTPFDDQVFDTAGEAQTHVHNIKRAAKLAGKEVPAVGYQPFWPDEDELDEATSTVKYGVFATGGSIGSDNSKPYKVFDTKEEAIACAKRYRSQLTPGERDYYKMGFVTKAIKESIESADPVEGAVLKAAQELIHQGHTDVAPEVITNMVVAATGKPFMLKDLVDANKKSPAIQHYIDSINPSKVKFSSDILTVKNENPAKAKAKSASTVSSMAAKAASRPRLGEAKKKSEVDESRGHKIVASKLKDIERWNKPIDDDAPKNWVVYNKTEDKPYMAFSSKQEAYNFLMDKMFFDKDYTVVHKSEIGEPTTEDIQPMANPQANPGSVAPANTPQTLTPNDEQSEQDPKTAAQTATALSTLKSAAGIQAQPQDIAKALDDASQGKQVAQTDMTKIKPMMDILKTAGTDPKVAQQFKTIATQAKTSQQQQLMKSKLAQQQKT